MKNKGCGRLTTVNKKGIPILKNPLHIERAISRLHSYEKTQLTPKQIIELQELVYNLQQRIRKIEEW